MLFLVTLLIIVVGKSESKSSIYFSVSEKNHVGSIWYASNNSKIPKTPIKLIDKSHIKDLSLCNVSNIIIIEDIMFVLISNNKVYRVKLGSLEIKEITYLFKGTVVDIGKDNNIGIVDTLFVASNLDKVHLGIFTYNIHTQKVEQNEIKISEPKIGDFSKFTVNSVQDYFMAYNQQAYSLAAVGMTNISQPLHLDFLYFKKNSLINAISISPNDEKIFVGDGFPQANLWSFEIKTGKYEELFDDRGFSVDHSNHNLYYSGDMKSSCAVFKFNYSKHVCAVNVKGIKSKDTNPFPHISVNDEY